MRARLASSAADEPYLRTLAFYTALDFRVLEEMPSLWGSDNVRRKLALQAGAARGSDAFGPTGASHWHV